jgi:hypothetical protein
VVAVSFVRNKVYVDLGRGVDFAQKWDPSCG